MQAIKNSLKELQVIKNLHLTCNLANTILTIDEREAVTLKDVAEQGQSRRGKWNHRRCRPGVWTCPSSFEERA